MNVAKVPIIFEDKDLLVLDKPAGLNTHEGSGIDPNLTVEDFVLRHVGASAKKLERAGLVHRLDKDTSGIILAAKNQETFDYLKQLFKTRQIHKTYTALLVGKLTPEAGVIDIPISRDTLHRTKFRAAKGGRSSSTEYRVEKYIGDYTLIKAFPKTGRTHQLRVHFASIGHPILGDQVYGKKTAGLSRHFLHASEIEFVSRSGKKLHFTSSLPADLQDWLGR